MAHLFLLRATGAARSRSDFAEKNHQFSRPGYVNSLLWEMAIEIVSFPIKNCDFP